MVTGYAQDFGIRSELVISGVLQFRHHQCGYHKDNEVYVVVGGC